MIGEGINTPFFCIRKDVFKTQRVHFSDRKYFSITFQMHQGRFYHGDKCFEVCQPSILFSEPFSPYAWEASDEPCYMLLFDDDFLEDEGRAALSALREKKIPIWLISRDNKAYFSTILGRMYDAFQSKKKQDTMLLKNYLSIILYEISRLSTQTDVQCHKSAAQRLAELFLNLLDSQFPLNLKMGKPILTTPSQYADRLCVHVNHLNKVIKGVTGKTTSETIAGRIIDEAIRLLQNTDLSIGEIGELLGFEGVASFSKFIRKNTGHCPKEYRMEMRQAV